MTSCRTSSRKSAPTFTNRHQRRPDRVRALGLKRNRAVARKKAPDPLRGAKATLSMPSSKSWTKTKRNRENLSTIVARSIVAGSTQKQKTERQHNLWQQLM